MLSLNNRKVSLVRTHSTDTHIQGLGALGSVITPVNNKSKLELVLTGVGVYAKGTSNAAGNQQIEFVIPFANCATIELVKE